MNHCRQNTSYRHGGSVTEVTKRLYNQGGVRRFYRGYFAALLQGPMSRFGDTAANAGVLALMDDFEATKDLNIAIKTGCASVAAGMWRIAIMPIDLLKTTLQVEGTAALPQIRAKIAKGGVGVLWHGAIGAWAATAAGMFPWFTTYNYLQAHVPEAETKLGALGRNALTGFCASMVSDTVSNSIRVLKTTRQTHSEVISYSAAAKEIIAKDGVLGLFGRGLKIRLMANAANGALFAVAFKYFQTTFFSEKE